MVVCRDYGGVRAVDPATGRTVGHALSPLSLDAADRDRDKGKLVQLHQWLRREGSEWAPLVENSTLGTLSADGRLVYAVEDLPVPPPASVVNPPLPGARPLFGPRTDAVFHNRLRALDPTSGSVVWEVGGRAGGHGADGTPVPDCWPTASFLGRLCHSEGACLPWWIAGKTSPWSCLRPGTGEATWSQTLASVPRKMVLEPARRIHAVHLAYGEGVLVCPTRSGAVLGVEPLSRGLLWAHTYSEERPTTRRPESEAVAEGVAPAELWAGCMPVVAEGRVLFTAADCDSVRCLDLRDGSLVWKAAAAPDELYLAGVWGDTVLVVGRRFCHGLDLATGRTRWRHPSGMPSGLGVLAGRRYYLPLRRGAVLALDLDRPADSVLLECRHGGPPGNLVFHGGTLWSQDARTLTADPPLFGQLALADRAVARSPRDASALYERGRLRREAGKSAGAAADLRAALAAKPDVKLVLKIRGAYFAALTDLLRRDFAAAGPYLDDCRTLCAAPTEAESGAATRSGLEGEARKRRTQYLALLARGREGQGRLEDAVGAYAELATSAADGERLADPDDPATEVRADLWAAARVEALAARATPAEKVRLRALAELEWQVAPKTGGVAALERFLTCYAPFAADGGTAARLLLVERLTETADDLSSALLRLEELETEREAPVAAAALAVRARILTRTGDLVGAVACYRRLARQFTGVPAVDGKTGGELRAELGADPRFLPALDGPDPPWEHRRVKAKLLTGKFGATPAGNAHELNGVGEAHSQGVRLHFDPKRSRLRVLDPETGAERWGTSLSV